MNFGERLKAARLQAGISQAQLAGSRFSVSYISHLEAGRRVPTPQVIDYLANQLGLERGVLSGADWGASPAHRGDTAMLAVLAAKATHQHGRHGSEQTIASSREGIELARELDRPEMWWQLSALLVDALVAIGRYEEAVEVAEPLTEHPWVMQNEHLMTDAHLMAGRALRFAAHRDAARKHLRRALDLTATRSRNDPQRLDTVLAALALDAAPNSSLEDELIELVEASTDDHSAGLGCWTLGNRAFEAGDPESGLRWHQQAEALISPEASFRDWARFARSSADERIKAGVDEGVSALLARATVALRFLHNPDEMADLARARAAWMQRIDPDAALKELDKALQEPDMFDLAAGRLMVARAKLLANKGRRSEAAAEALDAARRLTMAGAREEALEAWNLYDTASEKGIDGDDAGPAPEPTPKG